MIMIRAIIRPEKTDEVLAALMDAGFPAVTKMDVYGRGKQRGMKIGEVTYDELPKEMIFTVVREADKDYVVKVIMQAARTGNKGAFGDGKIFVSPVEEVYTVSSGVEGGRVPDVDPRGRRGTSASARMKPMFESQAHVPPTNKEPPMKEVLAIIRMNKMNETKQALVDAGVASFTARKVVGRGKGKVDFRLLQGAAAGHEEAISQFRRGRNWCPSGCSRSSCPTRSCPRSSRRSSP